MGIYPIHNLKSQVCKNEEVSAESRLKSYIASFLFFCNFAKKKNKTQKTTTKMKYQIQQKQTTTKYSPREWNVMLINRTHKSFLNSHTLSVPPKFLSLALSLYLSISLSLFRVPKKHCMSHVCDYRILLALKS